MNIIFDDSGASQNGKQISVGCVHNIGADSKTKREKTAVGLPDTFSRARQETAAEISTNNNIYVLTLCLHALPDSDPATDGGQHHLSLTVPANTHHTAKVIRHLCLSRDSAGVGVC